MKAFKIVGVVALILIATPVLLFVVGWVFLFLVFDTGTSTTVYERAVSPDGRRAARVQFSDCGAACSFQRQVVVEGRWGQPSCTVFQVHGQWAVTVRWLDALTLLVSNPAPPEDFRYADTRCGPVTIRVSPQPPSPAPPTAD